MFIIFLKNLLRVSKIFEKLDYYKVYELHESIQIFLSEISKVIKILHIFIKIILIIKYFIQNI